jgi:hypothetical protein
MLYFWFGDILVFLLEYRKIKSVGMWPPFVHFVRMELNDKLKIKSDVSMWLASYFLCICPYVAFFHLLLITVVFATDLLGGDTIWGCIDNIFFLLSKTCRVSFQE